MRPSQRALRSATLGIFAAFIASVVMAQAPAPPASPDSGIPTFSSTLNLVVVNVSVTSRNGQPIPNLTKNDFQLYEDGKLQPLQSVDYQRLGNTPLPAFNANPNPGANRPFVNATLETAPPVSPQYQNKRLIILLFDLSSMEAAEQIRARDAALRFLDRQMTANDMVSIMVFGNDLKTVQEFTADRERLNAVIRGFHIGESSEQASMADTGADAQDQSGAYVADETEFNIFNTDRKLAALQEAAQKLAPYPEKKALVYLSSGIEQTGVDNQSQLDATVNAAVRANVAFFPIDARGLIASAPGGDATQAGPVGNNLYTGAGQSKLHDSFQNSQETLYTLAADTGGKALLDSNDLTEGIREVQNALGSYYILSYRTSNTAQDGKYRRIQVKLSPQLRAAKAKLDYRQGYFAPTVFAKTNSTDREFQLQQALQSANPVTDLPLAVEIDYFRLGKDKYFVPITVRIPGSSLAFRAKGAKRTTGLDVVAEIGGSKGQPPSAVRDSIPLKVDESVAGEISQKQVQYDTGFTLAPGKYTLKFVARENGDGKVGTFQTSFVVPDLDRESKLRLSSLVVSNQIQPVGEQLAGAKNSKKLVDENPLVSEGRQKLVPDVTRVFHPGQNLYAFLEIYDPTVPENMPNGFKLASLSTSLALYKGEQKVFESSPARLSRFNNKRPNTLDLHMQAPLNGLKPGRYVCQVNVIDELGHKFAFPRASIAIVAN
jgi:VWFA-related protein